MIVLTFSTEVERRLCSLPDSACLFDRGRSEIVQSPIQKNVLRRISFVCAEMNSPQVSLGPILPVVTNSPAALTRALLSNKFLPKRIVGEYDKCIEDTVSLNPVEADYVCTNQTMPQATSE